MSEGESKNKNKQNSIKKLFLFRKCRFYAVHLWVNSANGFYPSAPLGGTFVNRHKSTQKDFASATAQEGIKMTALRGKSRISLPLRLQLSCAKAHLTFGCRFHLQTGTASGN